MAKNQQVQIGIGFDVDNSGLKIAEKELQNLHTQLGKISVIGQQAKGIDEYSKGLKEAGETASKLSTILEKSFSAKLGTINVTKFKQELDKAGMSTKSIQASLQKAGQEGSAVFARLGSALLSTNVQIKKSNTLLDEMATTMANTVKWGVTSSIFNNISNSVQDAYHYVKQLDSSLNDIRIVTDKSAESMAQFAVQANNAAKNLGASTRDYTDASLIYYQQGLSDKDVAARAETTLKAANVTGQNTAEVSEQLTAVWNGYKVSAQEAELYVDKLAAVAATTASDLEELSTGMSKVASAANLMGVDIDQLNAQLATIVSVTRQAPESVGTALKTIYARMGDIEAGIDTETTLGNYTKEMEAMGFNVLDANGNLRDMGAVVEEIGAKWTTLSREQQIALSQTMAGTRQYNNLLSLFDNWDMYTEAMNTSAEAAGTLQKQQDTYMESTEAHLQQLKTSAEDIYDTLIKAEEINAIIDIFKSGTEVLGTFFDTFGGGISSMVASAAILSGIFSKQIGQGLGSLFTQKTEEQRNADIFAVKKDLVKQKIEEKGEKGVTPEDTAVLANYEKQALISDQILQNQKGITNEQYQQRVELQNKIGQLEEEKILIKEQFKASEEAVGIENIDALFGDDGKAQIKILDDLAKQAEVARIEIQRLNKELDKIEDEDDKNSILEKIKEQESIVERSNAAAKAVSQYEQANIKQKGYQVDLDINLEDDAKLANIANTFDIIGNSAETAMIAIGGVKSIIDILNNEDLTFGEKLGQSFILLATTLPMVISSVKTVTSALKETNSITSIWNALIKIGSAENSKNAASEALLALAKKASAAATKDKADAMDEDSKETKENTKQNIANGVSETIEGGLSGKKGKKSISSAKKLVQGFKTAKASGSTTGAAIKTAIAGTGTLGTAITGLGATLAALAPIILSVGAAIGAVGGIIYLAYREATKYDRALEEAKESAKATAEQYEKVKNNYDNLMSSITNYQDAQNSLKELTKSTQEWNQAVLEINQNVLDLMNKYPELANFITTGEGGVITIEAKGLEMLKEQQMNAVYTAQRANLAANNEVSKAEQDKAINDWTKARGLTASSGIYGNSDNYLKGKVQQTVDLINTGDIEIAKDAKKLGEYLGIAGESPLVNYLANNTEALSVLAKELAVNSNIQQANTEEMARTKLEQTDIDGMYSESENQEALTKAVARKTESLLDDSRTKVDKEFKKDKDVAKDYMQKMGYSDFTKKDGKYTFKDKERNDVETNLSADDLRTALAYEYALQDAMNGLGNFDAQLSEFTGKAGESKDALTALINDGDLSKFSVDQLEATRDYVEGLDATNEEVIAMANLLGYESAETMISSLLIGINSQKAKIKEAGGELAYKQQQFEVSDKPAEIQKNAEELATLSTQGIASTNTESFKFLQEQAEDLSQMYPQLKDSIDITMDSAKIGTEEYTAALHDVANAMAVIQAINSEDGLTLESLNKIGINSLTELESAYLGLSGKIENYQEIKDAMQEQEVENLGLTQDAYNEYVNAIADAYKEQNKNVEITEDVVEGLQDVAIANAKIEKGLIKVSEKYKDWNKTLKTGKKDTAEYATALSEFKNAAEEILGVEVSDDFILENMNLFKQAAEGSEEALDQLRTKASEPIIQEIKANPELSEDAADNLEKELTQLANLAPDIEVGANLDTTGYTDALNTMLEKGEITAEQANTLLSSIGFDPVIEYRTEKVIADTNLKVDGQGIGGAISNIAQRVLNSTEITIPVINGKATIKKSNPVGVGSSKSGGGGGGGNSGKAEKITDFFEDEVDIYHEINTQLEILQKNYDKLAKAQEKLTGSALVDNLEAQTEAINDQIEALKTKRQIAEQEARTVKKDELKSNKSETDKLQKQYDKLSKKEKNSKKGKKLKDKINKSKNSDLYSGNLEIQYTDQGTIANYDEVLKSEQAAIRKMEEEYNKKVKKANKDKKVTDKEQKALDNYQKKIEKAKQNYEELKASMENYDELMAQTIAEIDQEMRDLYDQKIEIQIETFDSSLKLRLDSSQLEHDYNDFLKEMNEDDEHGLVEDMQINQASLTTYQTDIEHTKNKLNEALAAYETIKGGGIDATFGDNAAAALEKVKEYQELLNEQTLDYKELQREIKEQYLDLLDTMNEQLDEQYEAYENIDAELEHLANIQSKLFGEKAYDDMNEIITAQQKNNKAQIEAKKKEIAEQEKIKAAALEGSDEWEKANERIVAAQSDIRSLIETSLDLALTKYENGVNKIFDDAEKRIAGMSFEDADKEWESFSTYDSEFLDKINRAYGENSFKERVQSKIDNTNSIRTKEILNSLLDDELKKLKEKNKLTQYDVDRANKMLDITLKQIALEEAQNNKSKMRLRRDSQGNYSYQYVADQDNVNKLQDELDKAKNELYNFDKNAYKENVQKVKNQYAAMQEELKELALSEEYKSADKATQEQMQQDVVNRHQSIIEGYVESNNRIRANITSSALDEAIAEGVITQEEYDAKTEQQKQEWMDELVGIWDSGYQHIANMLNGEGGFSAQITELMDSVNKEVAQFQTTVSDTLGTSGESASEWAKVIDEEWGALTKEGGAIDSVNKGFDKILKTFMGDENGEGGLVTAAQATLKGVNDLAAGFTTMEAEASKAAKAAKDAIQASNTSGADAAQTATDNNTAEGSEPPTPSSAPEENKGDTKSSSVNNKLEKGDRIVVATKANIYKYDSKKKKFTDTKKDAAKGKEYNVADVKKVNKTEYAKISSKDNKWIKKDNIDTSSFDTGGYTGDWKTSEGRLAFLHKKELVLNAKDTENMLKMLDISRSMTSVMSSVSNKIKDMMYHIDKANHIKEMSSHKIRESELVGQLEQNVHIEATFPNVSQSHEIETAFNNLINVAAQRAYKNRR